MSTSWREQALASLRPTPEEEAQVQEDARALEQAVQAKLDEEGWEGIPRVEGSIAKGTYLHGHADADVFVQFPTDVDRDELTRRVHVLKELLDDPVVAYAEHPYAQGSFRGRDAEIVPCYMLESPSELRSAVDRTPFHTEYVEQALDDAGRDEVRLLKAFLRSTGAYGAEESVRGVSGYLAELLVLALGSFEAVLSWAVDGCPHPVTFDEEPRFTLDEDPLVVVDPIDASRNAAAAVSRATLTRLREAAAAFRAEPETRFFHEPPPARLAPQQALARCEARDSRVLAIVVPTADAELEDPIHAQLRRAVTLAAQEVEREQVPVLASATYLATDEGPQRGFAMVEADQAALHEPYLHAGPPTHLEEHAEEFRSRWQDDPSAVDELFEQDGRLFVRVERDEDTLRGIAEPHLREAKAGKIVDEALEEGTARVLEGKEAIAEVPPEALASLLDRRRPWQRPA